MENRLMGVLEREPDEALPFNALLERAGIARTQAREAKRTLKALVRRGRVERERGRRFRLSRAGRRLEALVQRDPRGMLRLQPVSDPSASPIRLSPDDAQRVEPGDRVEVEITVEGRQPRHVGKILEVLSHSRARPIGGVRRNGPATFVELDSPPPGYEKARNRTVLVAVSRANLGGAKTNDLVQIEMLPSIGERHELPRGRVVRVLGREGERPAEMERLIVEHELDQPFPPEVLAESRAFGDAPRAADIQGRRDIRNLPLVTIDGETAKDFDDAVCAKRSGDGFILYVAIADVSHYVETGSALDEEAYRRATSVYLTDRAIPMLPEALSNGLCSLNPRVDRLCMLAELSVDDTGRVQNARFEPAVMRSRARLTYTQVARALDGEPDAECRSVLPTLCALREVAQLLLARRLKRGALDLDLPEPEVVFDKKGQPRTVVRRARNDAHRLIEDLMLTTNEAVARFFENKEVATLFRVHEYPDPEKLALFAGLCTSLGLDIDLPEEPAPRAVSSLLRQIDEHPLGATLHGLLLRSLAQARYSEECLGHFGLASKAYLHFTSPIRRYPDLVVHRMLKDILDQRTLRYDLNRLRAMAEHTSNQERAAMHAERSSLDLDRSVVARERLGEEHRGTITSVVNFGLFAALDDPFVEGLIPVRTLPEDYYDLDAYGASLTGTSTGIRYMIGERLQVKLSAVSVPRRQVDLELLERLETIQVPTPSESASGFERRGPRRRPKAPPPKRPRKGNPGRRKGRPGTKRRRR